VVHDRHPAAEPVRLLHVVRGEQDRLTVRVQSQEQIPERETALGVEPGGGLVHEEHRRSVEDRAGDHQSLCHPAGQRIDGCLRPLRELELLEELAGDPPRLRRADAEETTVEVQVLPHAELAVERVRLRDDANQLLGGRGVPHDVDARDEGPAGGRDDPGREHPRRRRLAGAVRAEQAEDLPFPDRQVQLVDGAEIGPGVNLREVDRADDGTVVAGRPGAGRMACRGHDCFAGPDGDVLSGNAVSIRRPRPDLTTPDGDVSSRG
jgi:hypothetical protein